MQCFVKKEITHTFEVGSLPTLRYVCKAEADLTKLPCVMHMHEDRLEILFIKHGNGIHTIGGRQYHTKEGDILIYNSHVIHDERANPGTGMSVYSCAVSNLKLKGMRDNCLIIDGANPVLPSGIFRQDIEDIFRMMYSQVYFQYAGAEETCHYLLSSLLNIILKQVDGSVELEEAQEDVLAKKIKEYIDEHYLEDLTLEQISKDVHVSASYLCNIFKRTTNYAPIQYIMCRRIGKAQSLLITTKHSVTTIAAMVGYENSNYFNTVFTKIVGMAPIKFRKLWVAGKGQINAPRPNLSCVI